MNITISHTKQVIKFFLFPRLFLLSGVQSTLQCAAGSGQMSLGAGSSQVEAEIPVQVYSLEQYKHLKVLLKIIIFFLRV